MRRWLLRRLGALEWLEEIEKLNRALVAADTRCAEVVRQRNLWRKRAANNAHEIQAAREKAAAATARIAAAEARSTEAAAERNAAERRAVEADAERNAAVRLAKAHVEVFELLLEPNFGELCGKIRCYSEDLATRMARRAERSTGLRPMSMEAYTCSRCPLQPVTGERWWHVRMTDPAYRGQRKFDRPIHRQWVRRGEAKALSEADGAALNQRLFGDAG